MKPLLVLLVVIAGVWLWRNRRRGERLDTPEQKNTAALGMTRCARCGMHVPDTEAIAGHAGVYCSAEHLRLSELQ